MVDIAEIDHRLLKLRNYCGCAEGALAAIVSALAWFLLVGFGSLGENLSVWAVIAWGCLLFFLGGLVGKSVALGLAGLYRKLLILRRRQMLVKRQ